MQIPRSGNIISSHKRLWKCPIYLEISFGGILMRYILKSFRFDSLKINNSQKLDNILYRKFTFYSVCTKGFFIERNIFQLLIKTNIIRTKVSNQKIWKSESKKAKQPFHSIKVVLCDLSYLILTNIWPFTTFWVILILIKN